MTLEAAVAALTGGLQEATTALDDGRIADAAAALERVGAACRALENARAPLDAEVRARAQALHARCVRAAADAERALQERAAQAGAQRRANEAYGTERRR